MDESLQDYLDKRVSLLEAHIHTLISKEKELRETAWETHRHQHYAAERGHAELHGVHDEAHRREHGYTEEALRKAERQTLNRLEDINKFKTDMQAIASQHMTMKEVGSKLENYVTLKEFSTVRALVYGAVAMILTSFMGALVALVIAAGPS